MDQLKANQLQTPDAVWAQITAPLPINGAAGPGTVIPASASSAEREGWQAVIEGQLAEWGKDPSVLEDEGIEPPTRETIQWAAQIARDLCAAGLPAPQRVSATGDGGIVFTRQEGPLFSTIEVASDRSVELIVLKDYRVVSRRRLR